MADFGSIAHGKDSALTMHKGSFPPRPLSFIRLVCLVLFFIPYGLIYSLIGLYVYPLEAKTLYPQDSGSALSVMFAITGFTMILGPIFGKVSDESQYQLGRRRPYIIVGTICSSIAFLMMWWASIHRIGYLYMIGLAVAMTFLQLITNAQHGLLPDFVPYDTQGEASGLVAIFELAGSSLGFIYVLKYYNLPVEDSYIFFIVLVFASMIVTCFAANERPGTMILEDFESESPAAARHPTEESPLLANRQDASVDGYSDTTLNNSSMVDNAPSPPSPESQIRLPRTRTLMFGLPLLTFEEIVDCYYLDWGPKGRDFNLVFVSRFLYNLAISVQTFFLFFIRDVAEIEDEGQQKKLMAFAALTGQTIAALVALPMGKLSDVIGRKPLIYFASGIMAFTYLGFILTDFAAKDPGPVFMLCAWSALYGVGNGCFLAVDTALALDVIPNKEEAAKAMGVWTTSGFLAVMLGPTCWFCAMMIGGKSNDGLGYKEMGYDIMFATACAFVIMAAFTVSQVGGARGSTIAEKSETRLGESRVAG